MQTKRSADQYERQLRQEFAEDETHGKNPFVEPPKFAEFAERWMNDYVVVQNRPSTVKDKSNALRMYLIPELGSKRINDIRSQDIDRLSASLHQRELAAKTINNILSMIRCCLSVAVQWDMLDHVPVVRRLREPEPGFRYLTVSEEERFLAATVPGFWRVFLLFLLQTGVRFSEAANVCWHHIKTDGNDPFVHIWNGGWSGTIGPTKSGRLRELPLTRELIQELDHLPRTSERIFPRADGMVLHPASSSKHLYRICRRAGLPPCGWHVMRHTFATRHAENGTPLPILQRLMGHSTIKMTMRYVHVAPYALRASADVIRNATPIPWTNGTPVATNDAQDHLATADPSATICSTNEKKPTCEVDSFLERVTGVEPVLGTIAP